MKTRSKQAFVVGALLVTSMPLRAQEAAQPADAPSASQGQQQLPPLEVTAKQAKAKPKKQAVKPSQPAAAAAVSPQPNEPPSPPAETGLGPVNGYVAKRSVTGSKTDTPIIEIPQSISVVPADQIRDQGAKTITEALGYTPGTLVQRDGCWAIESLTYNLEPNP